jgi:hypothetical protein
MSAGLFFYQKSRIFDQNRTFYFSDYFQKRFSHLHSFAGFFVKLHIKVRQKAPKISKCDKSATRFYGFFLSKTTKNDLEKSLPFEKCDKIGAFLPFM